MTSTIILTSDENFKNLELCIKKLTKAGLTISYESAGVDDEGYRYVKIKAATGYGLYTLGIEMGKLSTNNISYV